MKFYAEYDDLIWDKENAKPLCKFKDGVYDAKDNREIEILHGLGYKHDEPEQVEVKPVEIEEKPKGKKVKK
jgi:hypothetical protein